MVTVSAPLLALGHKALLVVALLTLVMAGLLLASTVVRWQALPPAALLVFPALVCAALAVLGRTAPGLAQPYAPIFVLAFTYTGLTQSARTSALALAPGAVAYTVALGTPTAAFATRLLVVTAVWALLSQLLVRLTDSQQRLTSALRGAAHTDVLTGLDNRRALDERLAELGPEDTVVLCDLDHFKLLNDTRGHAAGDEVLAEFGALLRSDLRDGDYAARYGGEEFALVLRRTTPAQAVAALARLRGHWALLRPDVTFSSGIGSVPPGTGRVSAAELLARADEALYAAKAAGRNTDRAAGDHRAALTSP